MVQDADLCPAYCSAPPYSQCSGEALHCIASVVVKFDAPLKNDPRNWRRVFASRSSGQVHAMPPNRPIAKVCTCLENIVYNVI